MKFFIDIFVKKNFYHIVALGFIVILSNISYAAIMFFFSDSSQYQSNFIENIQSYLTIKYVFFLVILYGVSFIFTFFLQVYLANQFSIDLNSDMDSNLNVSSFKENLEISQALVVKDISSEFARFGNNIILPLTEIYKSIIAFLIIIVAMVLTEPMLLLPCLALMLLYSGFWAATKRYFVFISKRISELLFERQKYAEFKYQDYNELNSESNLSLLQVQFEKVLKDIATLNLISKTIAITPRAVIETTILAGLVVSVTWFDKSSFILLGLAGLKLVVSAQSISAGISNLQLNWPALLDYIGRRDFYKKSQQEQRIFRDQEYPTIIEAGEYKAVSVGIKFQIPWEIDLTNINTCLLRGPSGIGKSTFLNCFCGFQKIKHSTSIVIKPGNKNVSFLGQNTQIINGLVGENFNYVTNNKWDRNIARKLFEVFFGFQNISSLDQESEFEKFLNTRIGVNSGISGGEAKRIRIMGSLLSDAKVFIWDEPFDGIHPQKTRSILKYLRSLTHKTFLIIDHNVLSPEDVSATIYFSQQPDNSDIIVCKFSRKG